MKKRLLSLLLALVMALSLVPGTAFGEITLPNVPFGTTTVDSGCCGKEGNGTNLTWTLDSDGVLTIGGTGKMEDYSSSNSPWYSLRNQVKSVIIGDNVTSIGEDAFEDCSRLESVSIGGGVTSIGEDAFCDCSSLKSVSIGSGVTSIGEDAFCDCKSLTSVSIGIGVKSIGEEAFYGCGSLKTVYYAGSGQQWNEITVGKGNENLQNANIVFAIKTLATPGLPTLANAANGITVKWMAVKGAAQYRVYYKTGSGKWTKAGDTKGTSFTVPAKSLKSGTKYTFTIRCLSADGKSFTSGYNATGKSITYIATPGLPTLANAANGITVKWTAVKGAAQYRVYYKTGSGKWTKAGDTKGTSFTMPAKSLKSGTTYTFTVRCLSADGKSFTSSYNATGKSIVYLARTAITGLSNSASKTFTVKWNKITGVTGYQVYYKVGKTAKTVTVKSASAVSKAVSGLSKGSTYSVYVRGYKTVGKVNYYSAWSAAKTVKISK